MLEHISVLDFLEGLRLIGGLGVILDSRIIFLFSQLAEEIRISTILMVRGGSALEQNRSVGCSI